MSHTIESCSTGYSFHVELQTSLWRMAKEFAVMRKCMDNLALSFLYEKETPSAKVLLYHLDNCVVEIQY